MNSEPTASDAGDARERLQLALDAGAITGSWVWDIPNNSVTADQRFSRAFGLPLDKCRAGMPIVTPSVRDSWRGRNGKGSTISPHTMARVVA